MTISAKDLSQAAVFMAVAEERSFSGAGRRLGITGSAVGQTVRKLEQTLGLQLFLRTTRTVVITEQGQKLLDHMRPSMASLKEALRSAQETSSKPVGLVRVHAPRVVAQRYILPVLTQLVIENPGIKVDLTVENANIDLLEGGFDVAVRLGEIISKDAVAVRLSPDLRQFAVASPAFVARHGRPEHPRQLVQFPCIGWRWYERDHPYAWEFHENGGWFAVHVNGPIILNDRQLILPLALEGAGIALLSEDDTRQSLSDGQLINLLEPWCAPYPGWHLCYPRQRHVSPATRAFIDMVRHAASIR